MSNVVYGHSAHMYGHIPDISGKLSDEEVWLYLVHTYMTSPFIGKLSEVKPVGWADVVLSEFRERFRD